MFSTISSIGSYTALANCETIEEFRNNIFNIINKLGFTDFSFVRLDTVNAATPLTVNSRDLIKDYMREEFYKFDMLFPYTKHNTKPIFWKTLTQAYSEVIYETEHSSRLRDLQALNESHGYMDYYVMPSPALNWNGNVIFSVTTKNMKSEALRQQVIHHRKILHQLAEAIDYIGSKKFSDRLFDASECLDIRITHKELEIIDTLANNDLSIGEVANKLNMTSDTLKKHIDNAKKSLNTKHTTALIREAIRLKLISYKNQ